MELKKLKADLQMAQMAHRGNPTDDTQAMIDKAQLLYNSALEHIDDTAENGDDVAKDSSTGKNGASTTDKKSGAGSDPGKKSGAGQGDKSKSAGADEKSDTEGEGLQKKTEDPAS